MRHQWYNEIVAWAEGKQIQGWHDALRDWVDIEHPTFDKSLKYRIKPEPHPYQYLVDARKAKKQIQWKYRNETIWKNEFMLNSTYGYKVEDYTDACEWRIKPDDIVSYLYLTQENGKWYLERVTRGYESRMIKIVVDPDTKQVKDVVLLAETRP